MINTIFYFADTENEYMEKWDAGEISSKTISFIKDSNKIFINGHDYIDRLSIIDQLVADALQKDQALANLIRQELSAALETLRDSIDDANEYAEGVHNDLQGFKTEIAQDLTDSITAAITNANGRTIWTELSTTNEGLTAATNRINVALDANGNVKYTSALQSVINTGIDNNQAFTNIANRYAVLNDNQEIISWMTSGFKGHTDGKESFAAMYADAQEATQNAIAQVQTDVTNDAAGKYVAKAGLATEVQNIVDEAVRTDSLSYVASKSDVSSAESRMGAQYTTLNNALGTTNTTLSEVKTTADEGKARASLLTSAGQSGGYIINETALESSMVSIFNKSGDASTFIQQKANAAKEGAEATAQTLINTAVSNAASTYATQASLNNVETTLSSYLKDSNGNVITSASLKESVDENSASITALANNLETGTAAGLVSKAGLDEAVNGLLAQNSNANTKSTIQQIANNAAAETNIETRMKDALGVDALNKIAQKSYVDSEITTAKTDILSQVDTKTATAKAGAISEAKSYTDNEVGTVTEALNELSTSVADDITTVENKIVQESTINSKISTAKTEVLSEVDTKISNAKSGLATETYVTEGITAAKTDVLSLVDTKVSTATAGLATETYATTAATTAANNLKTEIWDSSAGKPKGVASLEQTVSEKIGADGSITNAITDLQTSVSTANTNASSALTQLALVDGKISTAVSELKAEICDSDGKPKGVASLEQSVTTAQNTASSASSAASAAQSTANENTTAINNLSATVSGENGLTTSIATLQQTVTSQGESITSLTNKVDSLSGVNSSELLLKSDLDGAVAGLIASSENNLTKQKMAASIVATVNDSDSTINLSADKINFTGSTTFNSAVQAVDITAKNIRTTNASNETTNEINSDGSGMLAKNGISWTVNGGLTLSLAFLQSLFEALGSGAVNNSTYAGVSESMYSEVPVAEYVRWLPSTDANNKFIPNSVNLFDILNRIELIGGSNISNSVTYYAKDSIGYTGCTLKFDDSITIKYGDIIIADTTNPNADDKFINDPNTRVSLYLDKIYKWKLTFDRGILVKKERADVVSLKTETELNENQNYNVLPKRTYNLYLINDSGAIATRYREEYNTNFYPSGSFLGVSTNGEWKTVTGSNIVGGTTTSQVWYPNSSITASNGDWIVLKKHFKSGSAYYDSNYYGVIFVYNGSEWKKESYIAPLYRFTKEYGQ